MFSLESLLYHYPELRDTYNRNQNNTRNKSIQILKITKTLSNKNSYIVAIRLYNKLPNELKTLWKMKKIPQNTN